METDGAAWSGKERDGGAWIWTGDADDFGARVVPVFPRLGDGVGGVVGVAWVSWADGVSTIETGAIVAAGSWSTRGAGVLRE